MIEMWYVSSTNSLGRSPCTLPGHPGLRDKSTELFSPFVYSPADLLRPAWIALQAGTRYNVVSEPETNSQLRYVACRVST